jgi:hypothetical protein
MRRILLVFLAAGAVSALALSPFFVPGSPGGQLTKAGSQTVGGTPTMNEIVKPFMLGDKGREAVSFEVREAGMIEARAEWKGEAETLSLILNGPGQSGYYARQNGQSPLTLKFKATGSHISRGGTWTLSVVNFGAGKAQGKVVIRIPAAAESGGEPAAKQSVQRPSRKTGATQSLEKSIKVLWPNEREKLMIGTTYTFRWQSRGIDRVRLSLGRQDLGTAKASDGQMSYRIPQQEPFSGELVVGDAAGSTRSPSVWVTIIQPPVDLSCEINRDRKSSNDDRRVFSVVVRNNGTRVLNNVMVNWVIKYQDVVFKQDGAGFSEMFPNQSYEVKITVERSGSRNDWAGYRMVFYVDPQNQQGEPEHLRHDNEAGFGAFAYGWKEKR